MKNFFFTDLIKNTAANRLSTSVHKIPEIIVAAGEIDD